VQDITFDEHDNPLTAPSLMKSNVICPECGKIVIVSLINGGLEALIEQEVID
jgi:hypothetical protein